MLLLSIASLLVMVIVFSASYLFARNFLENALSKEIIDSQSTLSIVLKEPIFNYDKELIGDITGAFVNDYPYIHKISVYDHRNKLLSEKSEVLEADSDNQQPLSDELIAEFTAKAEKSLQDQAKIEATDTVDFDTFLADYLQPQ